jgi:hypothetical protein
MCKEKNVMIDDYNSFHLYVWVRAKGCLRSCGMLFLSSIHYCVGECAKGNQLKPLLTQRSPNAREGGLLSVVQFLDM